MTEWPEFLTISAANKRIMEEVMAELTSTPETVSIPFTKEELLGLIEDAEGRLDPDDPLVMKLRLALEHFSH